MTLGKAALLSPGNTCKELTVEDDSHWHPSIWVNKPFIPEWASRHYIAMSTTLQGFETYK